MRKLLHVLNGLEVGGKERVALQLARRSLREGLEARLALFDTNFRDEAQDLDPGSIPVHFLPRRPGVDLRFAVRLAGLMRELGAEVIHAHNDTAIFYACLAARLVGRRWPGVCATFHVRPGHATRGARLLTRLATSRANRVTAVSDELADFVVDQGWAGHCETIWNGVDLEEFSPAGPIGAWRRELAIPDGALVLGHIGRFDPIKRQPDLVQAARRLIEQGLPLVLVLVGQGPELARVRELAAGDSHVRFVPRVVDVAAFLREVDLFVLCSEQEAAPRVLLEAMSCARAIVASEVGGIPAILHCADGEPCGVLVPPARPERLAEALRELAGDPVRRGRLGARARGRAADYSADEEWRNYRKLYEEIAPRD